MTQPALPLRDTPRVYGRVTRALHWSIAAMILWQLVGMGLKLWLGRESSIAATFVGSHQWVGTLVFGLIVVRVIWALINRSHRPAHGHGVIGVAARLGHLALYAAMVIVPLVAILRAVNVPARLVAVYAPGCDPMDFHAVAEAWVDDAWHIVDATRLAPRESMIRIATGRDAADTAFLTTRGGRMTFNRQVVTAALTEGTLPREDASVLVRLA